MTRIFIVEDHESVRESLCVLIARETDMQISGEADSAEAALETFVREDSDVVMMDVALPGMSGIELAGVLHVRYPDLPCVMFSGHGDPSYVRKALEAGANGYVAKWDVEELAIAIRHVLAGGRYVSKGLSAS